MGKRFRIRTIAGGGGGGGVGAELVTFEIENVATGGSEYYSFGGVFFGFGAKSSGSGPGSWTEFETSQAGLTEHSFEGVAAITSAGSSVGIGGGFTNIEWVSGDAAGECARGLGVNTGLGIGLGSTWGWMHKR